MGGFHFANSFCRETRFAGKLTLQGNLLLVNPTKTVILILVVKNVTCNTKVGGIYHFKIFYKKSMQPAIISKKNLQLTGVNLDINGGIWQRCKRVLFQ